MQDKLTFYEDSCLVTLFTTFTIRQLSFWPFSLNRKYCPFSLVKDTPHGRLKLSYDHLDLIKVRYTTKKSLTVFHPLCKGNNVPSPLGLAIYLNHKEIIISDMGSGFSLKL